MQEYYVTRVTNTNSYLLGQSFLLLFIIKHFPIISCKNIHFNLLENTFKFKENLSPKSCVFKNGKSIFLSINFSCRHLFHEILLAIKIKRLKYIQPLNIGTSSLFRNNIRNKQTGLLNFNNIKMFSSMVLYFTFLKKF